MGITDKVSQFAGNVQEGVKSSSVSLLALVLKVATSFVIALTFALIGQEIMKYGTLSFVFVMTVVVGVIMKIIGKWNLMQVFIFDLFCVLVGLLLRMYILIAP